MTKIEALDPAAFSAYLKETQNTICGRHPIGVLLNVSLHHCTTNLLAWFTQAGSPHPLPLHTHTHTCMQAVDDLRSSHKDFNFHFKFLKYAQSNRCTSKSDSSVSYASGSLTITQK